MKAAITTHILDMQTGLPAEGVEVQLSSAASGLLCSATTDADGRINEWDAAFNLEDGVYELRFATGQWFIDRQRECFFPAVTLTFTVDAGRPHYHVPLLLSPFGYSTYRGS